MQCSVQLQPCMVHWSLQSALLRAIEVFACDWLVLPAALPAGRNVLPPGLSHLAFIGLNATFQHVLTTALQAGASPNYLPAPPCQHCAALH